MDPAGQVPSRAPVLDSMRFEDFMKAAAKVLTDPVCGMSVDPETSPHKTTYRDELYAFALSVARPRSRRTRRRS